MHTWQITRIIVDCNYESTASIDQRAGFLGHACRQRLTVHAGLRVLGLEQSLGWIFKDLHGAKPVSEVIRTVRSNIIGNKLKLYELTST